MSNEDYRKNKNQNKGSANENAGQNNPSQNMGAEQNREAENLRNSGGTSGYDQNKKKSENRY